MLAPFFAKSQNKIKDPTEEDCKAVYNSLPRVDGNIEFTEVIQLDSSFSKDLLYRNAKLFFTNEFKSAKDVLQYDDRAEGKVIGKGNLQQEDFQMTFLVMFTQTRIVNFTLEIFCKDGKYKYRLYDIQIKGHSRASGGNTPDNVYSSDLSIQDAYTKTYKGSTKKMDRRLFVRMIGEINSTIADIKTSMCKTKSADDF